MAKRIVVRPMALRWRWTDICLDTAGRTQATRHCPLHIGLKQQLANSLSVIIVKDAMFNFVIHTRIIVAKCSSTK